MAPARRALLQTIGTGIALTAAAAALAAGIRSENEGSPKLSLLAGGSISIGDSLSGEAVIKADDFYPGASTTGTVTITNTGTAPGALVLRATDIEDSPGERGGLLSGALAVEITDITDGSAGPVFAGGLAEMPPQDLLVLAAGAERTYRFAVTMEDGGAPASDHDADNLLHLASSRFSYRWALTGSEDPGPCANLIPGDDEPNSLVGTSLGDSITGLGGWDRIRTLAGDDCVNAGGGPDSVNSGPGTDDVSGGRGGDVLRGGGGGDTLRGGPGADAVYGDSGDDRIVIRGSGIDFADCGSGADHVIADRRDSLRHC